MIKEYNNAFEFIEENRTFLHENKHLSAFFFLDAPLLNHTDKFNYCIRVIDNNYKLCAIRVEPYELLLYGNKECVGELLDYLYKNEFKFNSIQCADDIGECIIKCSPKILHKPYKLSIGMDFMISEENTSPSDKDVIEAKIEDVKELTILLNEFLVECSLPETKDEEKVVKAIDRYRILKVDGKIVSVCAINPDTEGSLRLSYVYTRKEYRGKGYARKVVNACKNEIIEKGYVATLNVDQKNPISNHLYASLGFKKIFSHGVYGIDE